MSQYTITVDGNEPFSVAEGTKLAIAIEKQGIDISHRCGGNARCTTCRVAFSSAEPAMGDAEKQCLEEDGVLGEFRLSCQIRVDQDMSVKVLMPSKENNWTPGPDLED